MPEDLDIHLQDQHTSLDEISHVGTTFDGRYLIEAEIGSGGMGKVLRALDTHLDRVVALKLLHPWLVWKESTVKRFQMEAKVLRSLEHPTIVRTYAMGLSDGVPFFVMDLVEGTTLDTYLKDHGRFTIDTFRVVFRDVMDALIHAHSRGVIHRDLKPSNILLSNSDDDPVRARVLDFGVAKVIDSPDGTNANAEAEAAAEAARNQELTRSGDVVGSPAYMSPEQSQGDKIDARSDIYSLCCVMYEALTGAPPFSGDTTLEVLYKKTHDTAPDLVTTQGVPIKLAQAIHQGLQKDPADRFQDVAELREAIITEALSDKSVTRVIKTGMLRNKLRLRKRLKQKQMLKYVLSTSILIGLVAIAVVAFNVNRKPTAVPSLVPMRQRLVQISHSKPSAERWEAFGDQARKENYPDIAMTSYGAAMSAYTRTADVNRVVEKSWSAIKDWQPWRVREAHRQLGVMISKSVEHQNYALANDISSEWEKRLRDRKDGQSRSIVPIWEALHATILVNAGQTEAGRAEAWSAFKKAAALPSLNESKFEAFDYLDKLNNQLHDEKLSIALGDEFLKYAHSIKSTDTRYRVSLLRGAVAYRATNRLKQASEIFESLRQSKDHDAVWVHATRMQAEHAREQGNFKEAERLFREGLRAQIVAGVSPLHTLGYGKFLIADCLRRQGKLLEAKPFYEDAVADYDRAESLQETDTTSFALQSTAPLISIATLEGDKAAERKWTERTWRLNKLIQDAPATETARAATAKAALRK